jgi:uncharacterized protein
MPVYFLDSSALVKGYRTEAGTPRVNQLLRGLDPLIISQLAHLEVSSALVRRAREPQVSSQKLQQSLDEIDREVARSMEVISIDDDLIIDAVRLTRNYGLRAADAIQLASALIARTHRLPQEFIFVSADDELNSAAAAEGLHVENPNLHP